MSTFETTAKLTRRARKTTAPVSKSQHAAIAATMEPFPQLEQADDERLAHWVARLSGARGRTHGANVEFGQELNDAKRDLFQHGQWLPALKMVGINMDKAQNLMAIARNAVLSNSDNFQYLPHAVSTNVTLAQLPERGSRS
jgi:hypothetical protein